METQDRPFTATYFNGKFSFEYTDTFRYELKSFWCRVCRAWRGDVGWRTGWVTRWEGDLTP